MRSRAHDALLISLCAAACLSACRGRDEPKLTFGVSTVAHDKFFPIDERAVHALDRSAEDGAITCDSCHTQDDSFAFSCTSCHEHREDATSALHLGLSQFRYASASCLGCHPRGVATSEIDVATHTAQYFPIDDASAHAAITCRGCHTSEADRRVITCTGCHDHDTTPMQLVHGQMPDYTWETQACRTCHARSENPGALDHPFFPTAPASAHEGVTCRECHETPADRTKMACVTCHAHEQADTDADHDGVPSYLYESGSCVLCHRQSQVPGEIQHTFFPIDPPATHALGTAVDNAGFSPNETIACTSCHTDPTTNEAVSCTRCHAHAEDVLASTHAEIPGYAWQDTSCLFCHPSGEPTGLIDHTFFPIATGTRHEEVSCTECHASASNRSLLACTSCHEHELAAMEPVHHGMPGWTFDSAACFTCHQQAQVPGTFDHEPLFPLQAPSGAGQHAALSCRDCHANPANRRELACTTCHVTKAGDTDEVHAQARLAPLHQGVAGYSWSPASCVGCHPTGTADATAFTHPYFPIAAGTTHEIGGANDIACADCHTNANDNTVVECTACHLGTHDQAPMTTTHAAVPGFVWSSAQCMFCHPNGEAVGNIDHELYFPIAAPAAHNGVACTSCHVDPNDNQALGCAQCHAADNPTIATVHTGIPNFSNTSPACVQCHPRAEPNGTIDHLPWFPIAAGTAHFGQLCTECHLSRADRSQNACSACHATVPPPPTQTHGQVREFANTSPNCKLCHADAQVDRLSSHTAFNPRHEGSRCTDCHRTNRADKPWAINFSIGVCIECHSASCTPNNQGPC